MCVGCVAPSDEEKLSLNEEKQRPKQDKNVSIK